MANDPQPIMTIQLRAGTLPNIFLEIKHFARLQYSNQNPYICPAVCTGMCVQRFEKRYMNILFISLF